MFAVSGYFPCETNKRIKLPSGSAWRVSRGRRQQQEARVSSKLLQHVFNVASKVSSELLQNVSHAAKPSKLLQDVNNVASRASSKLLKHVTNVASRASFKLLKHVTNVASRASWKVTSKCFQRSIKDVVLRTLFPLQSTPPCTIPESLTKRTGHRTQR